MLRDLAGERLDSLTLVLSYGGPGLEGPTTEVDRHREALEAYRELGVDWCLVGGPTGPAPVSADFLEAFAGTCSTG